MAHSALRRRFGRARKYGPRPMTLADAKNVLRGIGVSIKSTGYGDYRVAPAGVKGDAGAYFTDDLRDAVMTAKRQWGRAA